MKFVLLSLVVAIVGLIVYLITKPSPITPLGSKIEEAAKIAWAMGLLAFLLQSPRFIEFITS